MLKRPNGDHVGIEFVRALASSHDIRGTQRELQNAYQTGKPVKISLDQERGFTVAPAPAQRVEQDRAAAQLNDYRVSLSG
jgi:hypothetical protein